SPEPKAIAQNSIDPSHQVKPQFAATEQNSDVAAGAINVKVASPAPIPGQRIASIGRTDRSDSPPSSHGPRNGGLAQRALETSVALGRELFERIWVKDDSRSHGGDGLGPVFNGSSCLACHNLGGSGGAGPIDKNIEIVTASDRRGQYTGYSYSFH